MEDKTKVTHINGSYFVRIPAGLARYFELVKGKNVVIKDLSKTVAEITFSDVVKE